MRRPVAVAILLVLFVASFWPAVHSMAQDQRTSVSVVARSYDVLDVVWVSTDGSVQWTTWFERIEGNTFGNADNSGSLGSSGSVATESTVTLNSRSKDELNIFWIESNGAVRAAYWSPTVRKDTRAAQWRWSKSDFAQLYETVPGQPASPMSGIAAASRDPGHLDLFWIAPDGRVVRTWWTAVKYSTDRTWRPASAITDPDAADPSSRVAAVSPLGYPDQMVVFWVDPYSRLASSQNRGEEEWQSPSLLTQAQAVSPQAGLVALARATDRLDVFWITPDGAVQTLARSDEGWQPNPSLVAPPGSADPESGLAAIAPDPHHLEVFWVRPNGAVSTASFEDGEAGWAMATTLLAPVGSSAPGGTVAAVARTPADRDVFWVTPDGALGSVKRDRTSGAWQPQSPVATMALIPH